MNARRGGLAALAAGVVLGGAAVIALRCGPQQTLPLPSTQPARLFLADQPTASVGRVGKQPRLRVELAQPAYLYVFESYENGPAQLVWGTAAQSPERFEAGEFEAEGVEFPLTGHHELVAVTSEKPLPSVEAWRVLKQETIREVCPTCGVSASLTLLITDAPDLANQ